VGEAVRLGVGDEHRPVERRHRPRLRVDGRAAQTERAGVAFAELDRFFLLQVLEADVADEDRARRDGRPAGTAQSRRSGEAGDDDPAEPRVDE